VDTLTKYTVAVEDKQYKIDITKTDNPNQFTVKIDDKPHKVELAENKIEYETPVQLKIGEKTYTIQINKTSKQAPFLITINGIPLKAELKAQLPRFTTQLTETPVPTLITTRSPIGKIVSEGAVTAPMAGKIISVKVKKGNAVKLGQVLCILEAMKMENEILAPKAGTVQEIDVSEGTIVNEGQVLIIVK